MIPKRMLKVLQREHGRKDVLSALILLLIGAYMYAKEINYITYDIQYFSLIVLILGILLFFRSIASR